ncbi:anaerobic sulfatase maturase [Diplocloster hominis]|uniref:anaerobic sulfatase maturase n=1 Tax=Diplocloster hominis TaxID=3079010 RepID=UPI0031BBB357
MPALNLLIKPASGSCNLRCEYCFYRELYQARDPGSECLMKLDTLEQIIKKAMDYAQDECVIGYQGGEPTLAGLDFYRDAVRLQEQYNTRNLVIHNTIQTNGYRLNKEWFPFLAEKGFLVGISLDGTRELHDRYRKTRQGRETFDGVMDTIRLCRRYGVPFNILTVVTRDSAVCVGRIYQFFKRERFQYLQFIPCLDPFGKEKGMEEYSLSPAEYGGFLIRLFDLWYADVLRGEQPYIRQFENYLALLLGNPAECCDMNGVCGRQNVIEADGSVYPCDFYAMSAFKLGNLKECSFEEIEEHRRVSGFIKESQEAQKLCSECSYFRICRGGCKRNRLLLPSGKYGGNYFCESYKMFFAHALPGLMEIASHITAG